MNYSETFDDDSSCHVRSPPVEEIDVSGDFKEESHALRSSCPSLQNVPCLLCVVLLAGFSLGFMSMTFILKSEEGRRNENHRRKEPLPLESRIHSIIPSKHEDASLDSFSSYQLMAIERSKRDEDFYGSYSDERLKQVFGLLCLYFATNDSGTGWTRAPYWQIDHDECHWEGILCNNDNQVVEIDLTNFGLNGVLPAELTLVESALVLHLDENPGLAGRIPIFLGQMNLLELTMTECGYIGEMPEEICQLKVDNNAVILQVECLDKIACDSFCCENCI